MNEEINTSDFSIWVTELKSKIHAARNKLVFSINTQILELYWEIGREITEKQEKSGWGSGFIDRIATELNHEFPEIKGFLRRNVYAILQWYKFYSVKYPFVPRRVAQIPWGHHRLIITKTKNMDEAEFYCRATAKNGWNRDILEIQLENGIVFNIIDICIFLNYPVTIIENRNL
jgi:hypothetical protein